MYYIIYKQKRHFKDTAGQERFHSVTRQYFRKSDGILLFYDGTHENSFAAAENWAKMIEEECKDQVLILICNKVRNTFKFIIY